MTDYAEIQAGLNKLNVIAQVSASHIEDGLRRLSRTGAPELPSDQRLAECAARLRELGGGLR